MDEKIFAYVRQLADKKGLQIETSTDLYVAGILDSLGIITLLTYLEEELHVPFSQDDLNFENFQTVDKILKWVKSKAKCL